MFEQDLLLKNKSIIGKEYENFVLNVIGYELQRLHKPPLLIEKFNNFNNGLNNKNEEKLYVCYDAVATKGIYSDEITFVNIVVKNKKHLKQAISQVNNEIKREEFINYYSSGFKYIFITTLSDLEAENLNKDSAIEVWPISKVLSISRKYPIEYNAFIEYLAFKSGSNDYAKIINQTKNYVDYFEINNHNNLLLKELKNIGSLTLVVGNGISMPYNDELSWDKLVDNLYNSLPFEKQFENPKESFKIIGSDLVSKTQYSKNGLGNAYYRLIYKNLYPHKKAVSIYKNTSLKACVNLIANSNTKINKVITYNYDDYLEQELDVSNYPYNVLFDTNHFLNEFLPIYHVHGYVPEKLDASLRKEYISKIVLSEEDYFNCYNNAHNWRVFTQLAAFKDSVCLFVGNSLTDFNEKRLIKNTLQNNKFHYAIIYSNGLGDNDLTRIYSHFLYGLNIKVLWAKSKDEIKQIIDSI